jgi:hypothetical protein
MSLNVETAATMASARSRIGAASTAIHPRLPSRRSIWSTSPVMVSPVWSARAIGQSLLPTRVPSGHHAT